MKQINKIKLTKLEDLHKVNLGENVELFSKVLNSDEPRRLAQGTLIGRSITNNGEIIVRIVSELDLEKKDIVERTFTLKDFLGNQSFVQYGDCNEKFFLHNKFDIQKRKFDTLA